MNAAQLSIPNCRPIRREKRDRLEYRSPTRTPRTPRTPRTLKTVLRGIRNGILLGTACFALSGCGALLLVGGAGTSAIAFATGELQSSEAHSLDALDAACAEALDEMGYDEIDVEREAERIRWRAKTSGGEPVDVRLHAKEPQATNLLIRIGVFGNESRSRLLLEQIHQAL